MVPYSIPELCAAHSISYNLLTRAFSLFFEPNLSNLVVSAAKMAIIGTVRCMHAPSRLKERGASPETDARSLVTSVFAKPSRPGQVTTRVEFLGEASLGKAKP